MKKTLMMVGSLMALVCGAEARAADFWTAPVLVHANESVTCQAVNIGATTLDITVDLIDPAVGSVFGPANCTQQGPGGGCFLVLATGYDRWVYCHVTPGKKRNVRATLQVSTGASAVAQ